MVKASIDSSYFNNELGFFLEVIITLKNDGSDKTRVHFDEGSLTVSEPSFNKGKISGYTNTVFSEVLYPGSREDDVSINKMNMVRATLFPGHEKKYNYMVQLKEPGIYQLVFRGRPSSNVLSKRKEIEETYAKEVIFASDFIEIR